MIDKKTKGKIINAIRRLTYSYPPRNEAKRLCKIDKSLYKCQSCGTYCYDGKSAKTHLLYVTKYPEAVVIQDVPHVDHIVPVIPIESGWQWSWDDFIENMFCPLENLQLLCKSCHESKTMSENSQRVDIRRSNKLTK